MSNSSFRSRVIVLAPMLLVAFAACATTLYAQGPPMRLERQDDPLNRDPTRPTTYDREKEQQNALIGKEVEMALQSGNEAFAATPPRYADAERSYREALKLNPKEARAYLGLGRLSAAQEHLDDAIAAFKKAVELKPKLAEAYFNLGVMNVAAGKKDDAREQYRVLQGLNADLAKRLKGFIDN
ncbi:MAG: tetratricopeptide repeat protein [Pyrinomonadaceae bacterium]